MLIKKRLFFAILIMLVSAKLFAQSSSPHLVYRKISTTVKQKPAGNSKPLAVPEQISLSDSSKKVTNADSSAPKQKNSGTESTKIAKVSFLDSLKKALKGNTDTIKLKELTGEIDSIKIANTIAFTSPYNNTQFKIFKIGLYNVDTLNKYLYSQTALDFLQTASVQNSGGSNTYINAELGTYLFGPVKLGLGGSIKTTGDTTKDNAIKTSLQKIVSSGGAINLNFSLPLFFARSSGENVHFGIFAQVNNGFNPSINDSTGKTDYSSNNLLYTNQSGLIFHFDAASNDQAAKFTFDIPCLYTFGSNNTYSQLGIRDFSIIKLQTSFVIKNMLNLNISGPLWSSSKAVLANPFALTLGFSPSEIIQQIHK